jgi:(2Fe-2S) ferredoxin
LNIQQKPTTQKSKKQKQMANQQTKVVSFSTEEDLQIPCDNDWTLEEYQDRLWYTQKDLADIFQHCRMIVSGGEVVEEEPVRGLESMTSVEFLIQRKNVIYHILNEQKRLKELGEEVNPEALARIERTASIHRQRIAHLRAVQDAQVVAAANNDCVLMVPQGLPNPEEIRRKHRSQRSERLSERHRRTVASSCA